MDRWKQKELKAMELGGNKLARDFYQQNGMLSAQQPDHKNPALQRYKNDLKLKANQALGIAAPVAAPVQEAPKEPVK